MVNIAVVVEWLKSGVVERGKGRWLGKEVS